VYNKHEKRARRCQLYYLNQQNSRCKPSLKCKNQTQTNLTCHKKTVFLARLLISRTDFSFKTGNFLFKAK
jgi:hypothetical protein